VKRFLLLVCCVALAGLLSDADPAQSGTATNKNIGAPSSGFPRTVRVRLWYLHPPAQLTLRAEAGQAHLRKCATCPATELQKVELAGSGSQVRFVGEKGTSRDLRVDGAFQMAPAAGQPVRADFPVEIRSSAGRLQITATMPMDEYIAGVLAGEVGNFKSDEALKAMAVAARTYAMHFGSRHALEDFDLCDTTHCQDLRLAGINLHLLQIAESTAGEVLWYEGKPAAAYYHANCAGTTEDGRYLLADDEAGLPYLKQHSDVYCVRNGTLQWQSEISKRDLQRALAADGIVVPGTLHTISVAQRTPSGRVETLRIQGTSTVTVPATSFRSAVGRHLGWERLKSNWYEISVSGDRVVFHGRGSGHGVGLCQVGAEEMGEEGKSYREILAYYYPGTRLGKSAQAIAWKQMTGEGIELMTTRPDSDASLIQMAADLVHGVQASTGLAFTAIPQWKIYPNVAIFRDATGEPGWVAATTRGRTIQTQPAAVLRQAGTLESTVRHELLHMLIEEHSKPGTPLWFREGLVLYLSEPGLAPTKLTFSTVQELEQTMRDPQGESQLRQAYSDAHTRVAQLAQKYGKDKLILWVQQGLPRDVMPR
jgi:stage II sporulation protein D